MNLICKLFRQDSETREGIITAASGLGILVNLLLAAIKMLVGALASSIAIVSEGVNNLADAMTSILTLVGTKLAGKHPDEKHPFGYGRIEYLTSLVVAVLILVTGVEMLISSVKLVFQPAELSISVLSLVIVAVSAVVKFFLGVFTIKQGKKAGSSALEAVGLECRNDSFCSIVTILTAVIFLTCHLSLDAYAGIFTSLIILKAGLEVLKETVSELIGRPGEKELAIQLYKEILTTDGVLYAADMMLHNYGPDQWSGSCNLEIDHEKTVGEIYQFLHKLQLKIMQEYGVTMVFGIYAVDNDHEEVKALRKVISGFTVPHPNVKSFHAVYIDPDNGDIYCDFTVDYELRDWDGLRTDFLRYMQQHYPGRRVELVIETKFV